MTRLHLEVDVAIVTLESMVADIDLARVGVDALAAAAKVGTLDEIAERRAAIHKRLAESRRDALRLVEKLNSAREE